MNSYHISILVLFAVVTIGGIVWAIDLVPKQIEFSNQCERDCGLLNMTYETYFRSTFTNLNGECVCKFVLPQDGGKHE